MGAKHVSRYGQRIVSGVAIAAALQSSTVASALVRHSPCGPCAGTPQFTASSGLIVEPEIVIGFWGVEGSQWNGTNTPTYAQLVAAMLSLTSGPYYSALNQYGATGGGALSMPRLAPFAPIYTGTAPSGATPGNFAWSTDIPGVISNMIELNMLPVPASSGNTLYVIFVPNGDHGGCGSGCGGSNSGGGGVGPGPAHYEGVPYAYAFVDAGDTPGQGYPHEIAEALSGMEGIVLKASSNCGTGNTQISDLCTCLSENQNGFALQGYWSVNDEACVIPETWGAAAVGDDDRAWYPSPNSFGVRQLYGGGGGWVATDTNDNPFFTYPYVSWPTTPFGSPAAVFAVGGGATNPQTGAEIGPIIAAVGGGPVGTNGTDAGAGASYPNPLEATMLQAYDVANSTWTNLGVPNQVATGIAVTFGGVVVATDYQGLAWYNEFFVSGVNSWVLMNGSQADQVIAMNGDIIELTYDRNYVLDWPASAFGNPNGAWVNEHAISGGWRLVASPDSTSWGLVGGAAGPRLDPNGAAFVDAGVYAAGYSMAVTGGGGAEFANEYASNADNQSQVEFTTAIGQPLSYIDAGIGELVSAGSLTGTVCPAGQTNCVVEATGCAGGAAPVDVFSSTMFGCGGSVPETAAQGLCGVGYHVCSADEWVTGHGSSYPNANYWTSDTGMGYGGSPSSCLAGPWENTPNFCYAGLSMNVCSLSGTDRFGNTCAWYNCGYNSTSPNEYFGGCSANAGALCCSGCSAGTPVELDVYGNATPGLPAMTGCDGTVGWSSAKSLCAAGYHVCSSTEWVSNSNGAKPGEDYWTGDDRGQVAGVANDCDAVVSGGTTVCPTGSPTRVCDDWSDTDAGGGNDSFGNHCGSIYGCGVGSYSNNHFGGCGVGDSKTAGAVCCPLACANNTPPRDIFKNGMIGCGGSIGWGISGANASTLCATGYHVCSVYEWMANSNNVAPTADYWTATNINGFNRGSNGDCAVFVNGGTSTCTPSNDPMRVCMPSNAADGTDPYGNVCNWSKCGWNATSPNQNLGGCENDGTAGTLCCNGEGDSQP